MAKQLYTFLPNVQYPTITDFYGSRDSAIFGIEIVEGTYSFTWPNGFPCIPVEMFLYEMSRIVKISKSDGGTVGVYAGQLSHLVRYCYENSIEFWDLKSRNIDHFVSVLVNDCNMYNERKRNNNTIKSILSSVVRFLEWLQNDYTFGKLIVGVDTQNKRYQIKLKEGAHTTDNGHIINYKYFDAKLPQSISNEKKPISEKAIKSLWDCLAESKAGAQVNRRLKGLFSSKDQREHLEYMHKRRELQLSLLEATGLRPQELINICVSENREPLEQAKVILPTLKRGNKSRRLFPLDRATSIRIELFISIHRKKLINRLLKYGLIHSEEEVDDVIYLNSETARAVKPDAAYQEFSRLTKRAKISQKNCQSMFRHRFITNMVKLHLMSFMDYNPLKSRQLMTDNDYRTILTKVAKFTGHKNVNSLFHYIDLAWEELDVFSHANKVRELQEKLKSVMYLTSSLRGDLEISRNKSNRKLINLISDRLLEIENLTLINSS